MREAESEDENKVVNEGGSEDDDIIMIDATDKRYKGLVRMKIT
jgi:hypothetical protein